MQVIIKREYILVFDQTRSKVWTQTRSKMHNLRCDCADSHKKKYSEDM